MDEPSATDSSSSDDEPPRNLVVSNIDPSILSNFKKLQDEPQDIKDAYIRQITKLCVSEFVELIETLNGVDSLGRGPDEEFTFDDRRVDHAYRVAYKVQNMLRERGIAFNEHNTSGGEDRRKPIKIVAMLVLRTVHDHKNRFRTLTGSALPKEACWKLIQTIVHDVFVVDAVLDAIYVENQEDRSSDDEEEDDGEEDSSEDSSENEDSTEEEQDSATSEEEEEPEAKRPRHDEE
jgi:hypothetical protein